MFLRHARATRLAAAYLLFSVTLLMVPKADIPETPFDEANSQTNEMVVVKAASSLEHRQSVTVSVPIMFAQSRKISVHKISPVYTGQLTDSCRFQELLCSLLCSTCSRDITAFWFESTTDGRRSFVRRVGCEAHIGPELTFTGVLADQKGGRKCKGNQQ